MPAEHSADPRRPTPFSYLRELFEYQADRIPGAPAILAPGRAPLSYSRLYQHIEQTGRVLRAMGLGRHDRVAVVLPRLPSLIEPEGTGFGVPPGNWNRCLRIRLTDLDFRAKRLRSKYF